MCLSLCRMENVYGQKKSRNVILITLKMNFRCCGSGSIVCHIYACRLLFLFLLGLPFVILCPPPPVSSSLVDCVVSF